MRAVALARAVGIGVVMSLPAMGRAQDVKLPEGKILIPGVISHQTNVVEHPELVAWRIKNYASVVGRENLIAGADCGFSQYWDSIRVHPTVQWAKLQALAEGAHLASRELWN